MTFRLPRWLRIAALFAVASSGPAQSMRVQDLALGKFLVAPRDAPDPHFSRTVILLVQYGSKSAVGLMLNRRTNTPISRALEDFKPARNNFDPVYVAVPWS